MNSTNHRRCIAATISLRNFFVSPVFLSSSFGLSSVPNESHRLPHRNEVIYSTNLTSRPPFINSFVLSLFDYTRARASACSLSLALNAINFNCCVSISLYLCLSICPVYVIAYPIHIGAHQFVGLMLVWPRCRVAPLFYCSHKIWWALNGIALGWAAPYECKLVFCDAFRSGAEARAGAKKFRLKILVSWCLSVSRRLGNFIKFCSPTSPDDIRVTLGPINQRFGRRMKDKAWAATDDSCQ